jgi:drug/metabolite transporter (DMT)-like permease
VPNKNLRGIILFLTALFLFAVSDATAKYMTVLFAIPLLLFARYAILMFFLLAFAAPGMGREIVRTQRPWLMIVRALIQVASTLFMFLALRVLPLAEATALVFTSPLLVALLAGPLLGEKARIGNWLATLAGFVGVLLIVRPGSALAGVGAIYPLCAAFCFALYQILTRKLAASEPPLRQLFYIALVGTLTTACLLPFAWTGVMPTALQAVLLLLLGFCGGAGHFLLIRAFHVTPASTLSPMLYIQMIIATLLGWIVFGQFPDLFTVAGMLVIGGSGLSLILRQPQPAR